MPPLFVVASSIWRVFGFPLFFFFLWGKGMRKNLRDWTVHQKETSSISETADHTPSYQHLLSLSSFSKTSKLIAPIARRQSRSRS